MSTNRTLDQGTATAIRSALAAAMGGRLEEARRIGESALAAGGNAAALNAMLGTFCLKNGEYEEAVRYLKIAHAERADDPVVLFNLGTALVQMGSYEGALEAVPQELADRDPSLRLLRLRGFCAQAIDDYPQAIQAYERVLAADPSDWESWNNLGNCRRCVADVEGAVDALGRAASLAPDAPPVRLNYAMALLEAGKGSEGEAELKAMASAFPDDWRPLRELHVHFRSQAREDEALEAIEEASRRSPDDLDLRLATASQRLLMLDNQGAEDAYQDVVKRDPHNASGNLGLAVVYELSNRTEDLAAFALDAEERSLEPDVLNFIRAFDHRRAKRFDEGLAALAKVPSELEPMRQAQLAGQLEDGAGNYDKAWAAFLRMNALQLDDPSLPEQRASAFRAAIARNLDATTSSWAAKWVESGSDDGRSSPVFLVGFPRSGTTLLDTMLMGHPRIEVLEEEATLAGAGALLKDYPLLPVADRKMVQDARNLYFEEVATHTPMAEGNLILDKNPMSMVAMPLIRRLFPDAKIILAVRHPCDVVLSCFTTNFRLNDAMSSFLRLDTTADLYDLSFRSFERAMELLPMNLHTILYENVVADREGELKRLFDFLGVEWNEAVLDHQATALKRGRIKTASYSQVAEPIYTRSSGRWQHYRKHLEPILPVVRPWIEKFGYTT